MKKIDREREFYYKVKKELILAIRKAPLIRVKGKRRELDYERQLFNFLCGKISEKNFRYEKVFRYNRIDITYIIDKKHEVGIELKLYHGKQSIDYLIGQCKRYLQQGYKRMLAVVIIEGDSRVLEEGLKQLNSMHNIWAVSKGV